MTHLPIRPGILYATRGQPNPSGEASTELYLLHGAPAAAPVREIVAGPGVTLPRRPDLPRDHPFPSFAPLAPPSAEPRGSTGFRLQVLHFNDLHGRLADVSRDATRPVFSRMAGY